MFFTDKFGNHLESIAAKRLKRIAKMNYILMFDTNITRNSYAKHVAHALSISEAPIRKLYWVLLRHVVELHHG